jgi:hypothetical protein
MYHAVRLLLGAFRLQPAPGDSPHGVVMISAPAIWLLLATAWVVLLVVITMLALEIVILMQVFDLVDLIEKLVPGG